MRHYERIQCLATIDYKGMGAIIAARCAKDCRHGHSDKRVAYRYHRADFVWNGIPVFLRWDGIGVMPPELEKARAEMKEKRKITPSTTHWGGEEQQ